MSLSKKYISKLILIITLCLFYGRNIQAQSIKNFPINEFSVSGLALTSDFIVQNSTHFPLGFGLGLYRCSWPDKVFNLTYGAEYHYFYNRLNRNAVYYYSQVNNLKFHSQYISLLILPRVSLGKKTKFFIEGGYFLNININSRITGIGYHTPESGYVPGPWLIKTSPPQSFGAIYGLGFRVPIENIEIVPRLRFSYSVPTYKEFADTHYDGALEFTIGIILPHEK